jgi:hypothetical protein
LFGSRVGHQVAGKLLAREFVERLIVQQRAQDVIAIRPRGALAVAVVSGGIRIAHGIEPGYGLVLGVCLRGQEAVDDFLRRVR